MLVYFCSEEKKNFCKAVTDPHSLFCFIVIGLCFPFSGLLVFVSFMMDQGEPGKDLPILEQTREADPHETESSKKMEATTEPTPDTLMATAEMPKVIFFFADLNCGFSSKYVVIFLEKEVCAD